MRTTEPPTQPRPSSTTIGANWASPWKKIAALPVRSFAVSAAESLATLATPLPASSAPPAKAEFAQPWPLAPSFAHGQGVPLVPSPRQKVLKGALPGTSPVVVIALGVPGFQRPIVITPLVGAA